MADWRDGQKLPGGSAETGNFFPWWAVGSFRNLDFIEFFVSGIVVAMGGLEICMIEALFNQTNYLTAKKTLDAVVLRQEAIANNLANLETPGYQRVDLAPQFEQALEKACAAGDSQSVASLSPTLTTDASSPAGKDGNTVHLEAELMKMNQNAMTHALETQMISGTLAKMRMAITGHS